jgi:serine/threonine protein kinase
MTSVPPIEPGSVVAGRFHLDRLIGEGGMGTVWAATHTVTRKPVALKLLKPERASDPNLRQRFEREARAACAVRHPNIVEIHDVLTLEDGTPIMVMELLEGESLGTRLDRERLEVAEFARLMQQVISAVGTAHASGIVHRDLKPDNIFLVRDPEGGISVKVLDFGIAKVMSTSAEAGQTGGLTGTGAMLGTPYYMSPEQIFGERDIDHRADVWALGVIFYECLAGQRPTQADNIGQILKIITTDAIVPLERLAPWVPADLCRLIGRMLSRDRLARPSTLTEVRATLAHYTDAAARSFGEPAVNRRSSLPSETPSEKHLIRTDDTGPYSQTAALLPTTGSGVRIGSGEVSPVAATLASTTASTTAESKRMLVAKTRRRRVPFLLAGGAAVVGVLAAVAVVRMRPPPSPGGAEETTTAPPPVVSVVPSASAPPAISSSTVGATAPSAPSASAATTDGATSAPASSGSPAASRTHPISSHTPAAGSSAIVSVPATTSAPTSSSRTPGGVIVKPPF